MLPPAMPARCAMTCSSMRTPLGIPDCCFFVEYRSAVATSNCRTGVPGDRASRVRRARHHSIDQPSAAAFRDLRGLLWMASLLKLIRDFRTRPAVLPIVAEMAAGDPALEGQPVAEE